MAPYAQLLQAQQSLDELTAPVYEGLGLYEPIYFLAPILNREIDEIIVLAVAVSEFVVCLFLPYMRDPFVRKVYATTWGFAIGFYAYGATFWMYLGLMVLGYVLMVTLPKPTYPMIVICFIYLQFCHYYFFFEGRSQEICVKIPIMIGFNKIMYAAINLQDADTLKSGVKH